MNATNYIIIEGSPPWADKCREFCRQAYLAVYEKPERHITKDLFSKEVFASSRIKKYFQDVCQNTPNHKNWLAVNSQQELLGMVAAHRYPDYVDMKSFYVKPGYKGMGIGHALYQKVHIFAGSETIQADVIEYMNDTIAMYKHWGFVIDNSKGKLTYDIPEWPEKARHAYRAIYMIKPGKRDFRL